jgi:hypothetical protein
VGPTKLKPNLTTRGGGGFVSVVSRASSPERGGFAAQQNTDTMPTSSINSSQAGLPLQRKCACGGSKSSLTSRYEECKPRNRFQAKFAIGASTDNFLIDSFHRGRAVYCRLAQVLISKCIRCLYEKRPQSTLKVTMYRGYIRYSQRAFIA